MPMPVPMSTPLTTLLHAPRWRPLWRALLLLMMLVVGWLAFTPTPPALPFDQADKIEHALAFAALAAAAALAGRGGQRGTWIAAASMLAFGGFIELVQTQIPGRTGDWFDLAADACGIAIGLAAIGIARRRFSARI